MLSSIEAASFEIDIPPDEDDPEQQYQQQAQRLSNKTKKTTSSIPHIHFSLLFHIFVLTDNVAHNLL